MATKEEREANQVAYRRLKHEMARIYPKGQFVATFGGRIIADAPTMDELLEKFTEMGLDSRDALVEQAGIFMPDYVRIF